jgi:deoxyribodipyrimidine photolyase
MSSQTTAQTTSNMTQAVWFRRDLRVDDNAALYHASSAEVYAAFA